MSMDNVFEIGLPVLLMRIAALRQDSKLGADKNNEQIIADMFDGFEYNYQPYSLQSGQGETHTSSSENYFLVCFAIR